MTIEVILGRFSKDPAGFVYGYHILRDDEIVYVGVTRYPIARGRGHETEALINRHNGHKNNGIRKARKLDIILPMIIKRRFTTANAAFSWEIRQIAKHKRTFEGGTLWNATAGGEGGLDPSPETLKKKSENSKRMFAETDHPFKGGSLQRETHRKRFEDGTHHLLDPQYLKAFGNLNQQMISEGRHVFQTKDFYTRRREKLREYHNSLEFKTEVAANSRRAFAKRQIPKIVTAAKVVLNWKRQEVCAVRRENLKETGIAGPTYKDYGLRCGSGKTGYQVDDVLACLKKRYDYCKNILSEAQE